MLAVALATPDLRTGILTTVAAALAGWRSVAWCRRWSAEPPSTPTGSTSSSRPSPRRRCSSSPDRRRRGRASYDRHVVVVGGGLAAWRPPCGSPSSGTWHWPATEPATTGRRRRRVRKAPPAPSTSSTMRSGRLTGLRREMRGRNNRAGDPWVGAGSGHRDRRVSDVSLHAAGRWPEAQCEPLNPAAH